MPGDARAVDIDHAAIVDEVADAEIRQIALLAANLTRSEADDILSDLRGPPKPASASAPTSAELKVEEADLQRKKKEADAEDAYRRLEATLRYHVESDVAPLLGFGMAEVVVGAVALPVGFYLREGVNEPFSGNFLIGAGSSLVVGGFVAISQSFTKNVPLRDLHLTLRDRHGSVPTASVVEDAERVWRGEANHVRRVRHWAGGIGLGVGVISLGIGTGFAVTTQPNTSGASQGAVGALFIGVGGALTLLSTYLLLSPSDFERNYESYMRASKGISVQPGIAPLPGGAALSLSGRF